MEVIFLGTSGASPTKERNLPSIGLKLDNGEIFIFDTGEDVQRRFEKANIRFNNPTTICISHLHGDHIIGLPGLLFNFHLHNRDAPLRIIGPEGIALYLNSHFRLLGLKSTNYELTVLEIPINYPIGKLKQYQINKNISNYFIKKEKEKEEEEKEKEKEKEKEEEEKEKEKEKEKEEEEKEKENDKDKKIKTEEKNVIFSYYLQKPIWLLKEDERKKLRDLFFEKISLKEINKEINILSELPGFFIYKQILTTQPIVEFVQIQDTINTPIIQSKEYQIYIKWVNHTVPTLAFKFKQTQRPGKFNPQKAMSLNVPRGFLWKKLQQGEKIQLKSGEIIDPIDSGIVGKPRPGRILVYTGDTAVDEELEKFCDGVDIIIAEATFTEENKEKALEKKHFTAKMAAELAQKANVKWLVLTHYSTRITDVQISENEAKSIFTNVFAAKDLDRIKITTEYIEFIRS